MALTPKQKAFIDEYRKSATFKEISIENVVKGLICLYLEAERETDKEHAAWLIARIKPEIKLIGLNQLIDVKELNELAIRKQKKEDNISKYAQKRRHQKRSDFALTDEEWQKALEYFDYKCAYCGKEAKQTYDHLIPFSKGGSFKKDNIIPACKSCNSSKRDNNFKIWYRSKKFYSEEKEQKINSYIKLNSLSG